jgi:hypothetical protein
MKRTNMPLITVFILMGIVSNAFGQADMKAKLEVNGQTSKDYVEVGMRAGATDGFDNAYDTIAIGPGLNDTYVFTFIDHPEWAQLKPEFRGDIRSIKQHDTWTMLLETNMAAGTVLTLKLRDDSVLPAGYALTVKDIESGTVIDPKAGPYQFSVTDPAAVRTFVITAAYAETPGAPVMGQATAGNAQATVSFSAPALSGTSAITGYTVKASPGGKTATGTSSPLTVTGLANGRVYTFTVTATNAVGTGAPSAVSNSVTPVAPGAP